MAIKESRDIVIEASPEEILDVIADFEAMTEGADLVHHRVEILETGDDGRPSKVKMKVKTAGITDEQVVAYSWTDRSVRWTLVSSTQQRSQDGKYELTPKGDNTLVQFEITVDPQVPLPGFVLKRAIKGTIDTATEALRSQVLKVKKGQ